MKDPAEQKLINRIRYVFDNYEDDSAESGWNELRKKYPEKNKRRTIIMWIGSAAAIVMISTGLWFFNPYAAIQKTAKKPFVSKKQEPFKEQNEQKSNSNSLKTHTDSIKYTGRKTNGVAKAYDNSLKQRAPVLININTRTAVHLSANNPTALPSDNSANEMQKLNQSAYQLSDSITPAGNYNNVTRADAVDADSITTTLAPVSTTLAFDKLKASDGLEKTDSQLKKSSRKDLADHDKKRVTFGIYAGSFITYAEKSKNNLNTGAGITSDIPLTNRLKLATGISIARNNLSFTNGLPAKSSALFDQLYSAPATGSIGNSHITTTSLDATLLGLDVPINLKYNFPDLKNEFFISAGFSSGTFIRESYTYRYNITTLNAVNGLNSSSTSNEEIKNRFNGFNFARTLNLSFGLGYSIGKTERLFIEPFLKYPLSGLGTQNIRFGSGGLNLKLNFSKKTSQHN